MAASTPDRDDEDSSANGDCSEEQIFWAAQLFAGNLTLENDELLGEAILNVLVVSSSSDPEEERSTKRIKTSKPAEPPNPCWSLETTQARIREFHRLAGQMDDSSPRSLCSLMDCWLGCSENSCTSTVSPKENQPDTRLTRPPFCNLFRNALISMAHLDLANAYMERSLDTQGNLSCCALTTTSPPSPGSLESTRRSEWPAPVPRHMAGALHYWPTNPSALVLAANWERMRGTQFWPRALELYRAAMKCAHITTTQLAQPILRLATTTNSDDSSSDDDDDADGLSSDDKFLVETVLCQSAQQQDKHGDDDQDTTDPDNDIGESQVLVTAAYMSALLASCLGQHDAAADSLRHFSSPQRPITRIHPRVWDTGRGLVPAQPTSPGIPCVFPDAISLDLFHVLRQAFRADGPYWNESGYSRNVYYSFWTDYPLPRPPVNNSDNGYANDSCCIVGNAVEHYIVAHLLPRVQSVANSTNDQQVRGFEWWVHTRPHGANIGHQLHFDTDEALLEQDGTVEFPIAATVTYLTLDDGAPQHGATVLFDQTPYTKTNAETAYISFPQSRSLLVFPGNLLHGVLPCSSSATDAVEHRSSTHSSLSGETTEPHQRLTFMVNFWGYCIPDRIHKRSLYGPSGPLPPLTPEHTWVRDICRGYPKIIPLPSDTTIPPSNSRSLVAVSPAWDALESSIPYLDEWSVSLESPLTLPASSGIQQRFFVTNAPDYFHSTLLEK